MHIETRLQPLRLLLPGDIRLMEIACCVDEQGNLNGTDIKYERIYLGSEFCPNLLLSTETLVEQLRKYSNIPITLALPFIPESYTEKALELIEEASEISPSLEVAVQNWGLIDVVLKKGCIPIIGRLLIKQFKDPRLVKENMEVISDASLPKINSAMLGLIHSIGVKRIEIDSPPWGRTLPEALTSFGISVSLHVPYTIISVTRYCKLSQIYKERQDLEIVPCGKECLQSRYVLKHPTMKDTLLLYGNAFVSEYVGREQENLSPPINRLIMHSALGKPETLLKEF
jgi:hypothetical protein